MRTKATTQTYKGHPTISIWEVDDAGHPVGRYPIASFGIKKAQAIFKHVIDVHSFLGANNALPQVLQDEYNEPIKVDPAKLPPKLKHLVNK